MNLAAIKRLAEPQKDKSLAEQAQAVIEAREVAANVATMLAEVEDAFKKTARESGVTSATLADGTKVTAVLDKVRRSADSDSVEGLRGLLADDVFTRVTKTKVDWKKWDSADEMGLLPEGAGEFVKETVYDSVLVTKG